MEPVTTAAAGYNYSVALRTAFSVISSLNLYADRNPPDACVRNNSAYYDYIVVGTGTSGCVLASRLSQNKNVRVLALEAGGNPSIESVFPELMDEAIYGIRETWNYVAEPNESYKKCHQDSRHRPVAAKVLGGLSSIDFLLYSQGTESDYNAWAKLTNDSSWTYSNVIRLYNKLENFDDPIIRNSPDSIYHGFNGNVGITKEKSPILDLYFKAYAQIGIKQVADFNNRTKHGVTNASFYIQNNTRQSTAFTYLYKEKYSKNLDVLKNILVTRILFEGKRAVGVEALDQNNNTLVFRANKEVIISAGPFNTPKLLQLSGIGPKNLLESLGIEVIADLPVGENYQTHVSTVAVLASRETNCTLVAENNNPGHYPLPTAIAYNEVSDCDSQYRVYRILNFFIPVTPATVMLIYGTSFYRFKNDIVDKWYNECKGREMVFTQLENTKVVSRGSVRIRSTDPFDPPIINGNYYYNRTDVENMIKYVKDFRRIIDTPALKKVGAFFIDPEECSNFAPDSDEFYECYVRCLMVLQPHDCGTTALGTVVDGAMRVKGVEGLRVVGASIMPDIIAGSITMSLMMMGEMAAERIMEDYNNL